MTTARPLICIAILTLMLVSCGVDDADDDFSRCEGTTAVYLARTRDVYTVPDSPRCAQ